MTDYEVGCIVGTLLVGIIIFLFLAGTGLFDDWVE